jgi:DNA-binding transcriptional regulator YiaG
MEATTPVRHSGLDLKLMRVAADVRTSDLAFAMGVTDSRISYIEGRRVVTETAAERYLSALATLTTKPTDQS